jgi:hypothetical protein
LEPLVGIGDKWTAVLVHGAGGYLTVSGPVCCGDGFETDVSWVVFGRRGVGVYWKGVWPAGCDSIDKGGVSGAVEGLEYLDEDEFLIEEGWVCGGVVIELVADVFWREISGVQFVE